jgi:hypothetical protein
LPTPEEWQKWTEKWPDCGIVVVDVDKKAEFKKVGLSVPMTWTIRSRSGGSHYYYQAGICVHPTLSAGVNAAVVNLKPLGAVATATGDLAGAGEH